ncbi:MAG: glycerophosphodiester phosphodiesterase family protein [Pseudomonadota bacterium]
MTTASPGIVAHRGYAGAFPENTLPALRAAFDAGVHAVEFDVQLSADGHPFVLHDVNLQRTAGIDADALDLSAAQLSRMEVNETARLGDQFMGVGIPRLTDALALVVAEAGAHAFVELKPQSISAHPPGRAAARVVEDIHRCGAEHCSTLISFDTASLEQGHAAGLPSIGWVLPAYDDATHAAADALSPKFLFCDYKKLPPHPEPLWQGTWEWVIYEVTTRELAAQLFAQGAQRIETMQLDVFVETTEVFK